MTFRKEKRRGEESKKKKLFLSVLILFLVITGRRVLLEKKNFFKYCSCLLSGNSFWILDELVGKNKRKRIGKLHYD